MDNVIQFPAKKPEPLSDAACEGIAAAMAVKAGEHYGWDFTTIKRVSDGIAQVIDAEVKRG